MLSCSVNGLSFIKFTHDIRMFFNEVNIRQARFISATVVFTLGPRPGDTLALGIPAQPIDGMHLDFVDIPSSASASSRAAFSLSPNATMPETLSQYTAPSLPRSC